MFMSGANGFGPEFGGAASEMPPLARPPAPPAPEGHTGVLETFRLHPTHHVRSGPS